MLRRRTQEYDHLWDELEREVHRRGLPDRMVSALAEAAVGLPVTNALYRSATSLSSRAAANDLKRLVRENLLVLRPADRTPCYLATDAVASIRARTRDPYAVEGDPFGG